MELDSQIESLEQQLEKGWKKLEKKSPESSWALLLRDEIRLLRLEIRRQGEISREALAHPKSVNESIASIRASEAPSEKSDLVQQMAGTRVEGKSSEGKRSALDQALKPLASKESGKRKDAFRGLVEMSDSEG